MNHIETLIAELCPEGVEYKELGKVMQITRGASPRPILNYVTQEPEGVPWIKIGDVSSKSKYVTNTKERITKEGAFKSRFLKKGDFILSNSMSFGRPYILAIDGCIHDGWISMRNFKDTLYSDFLYHLLRSDGIQNHWKQVASSGTVQNLNADLVRATKIPIPPLPIQQEIVNTLDKFTQLEAELEAELEARRKQYEYYRHKLMMFDDFGAIQWTTLNKVAKIKHGKDWKKLNSGNIPVYGTGGIMGYVDGFTFNKPTVLIPRKGSITNIYYVDEPFWNVDTIYYTEIDTDNMLPKFLFHFMKTVDLAKLDTGSGRPSLTQAILDRIIVPVPPLSEQQRIVAILDKFDALVNDISIGLPAEITARRKQYEYYRSQLLTFKNRSHE